MRAERNLKLLMTDDPADPIWSVTLVPTNPPEVEARPVDIRKALSDAMRLRPELAAGSLDVSVAEAQTALAKDALRPQVDIVAGYTARGLAGTHNPQTVAFPGVIAPFPEQLAGALGVSYQALAQQHFPDASIGVSVDVPLGRHAAKGDYAVAQSQQRQASLRLSQTRDRIAVDVLDSATALETAASRMQAARAGAAGGDDAAAGRTGSVQRRHEHEFPRAHAAERPRAGSVDGNLGGHAVPAGADRTCARHGDAAGGSWDYGEMNPGRLGTRKARCRTEDGLGPAPGTKTCATRNRKADQVASPAASPAYSIALKIRSSSGLPRAGCRSSRYWRVCAAAA